MSKGPPHGAPGPVGRSGPSTLARIASQISRYPSCLAQRSTSARSTQSPVTRRTPHVPQMAISSAFGVLPEFAQNHVFGGGRHDIPIGKSTDRTTARHFRPRPISFFRQDRIDLIARSWMNDVELKIRSDGIANRRFAEKWQRRVIEDVEYSAANGPALNEHPELDREGKPYHEK